MREVTMGKILDEARKYVIGYDQAKTGEWLKPELPPENQYSIVEVKHMFMQFAQNLEGYLSDKFLYE